MRGLLDGTAVIFDLDGTLVDTAHDLGAAMNHTLVEAGLPPVPLERVRGLIGAGARAMLKRGFAEIGAPEPGADALDRQVGVFIDYYRANIAIASRPFPGVLAAIDELSRAGAAIAVCTNKRESLACALIAELGLDGLFACIVGGDTAGAAKPDPRPVRLCLEKTGAQRGVFIGDSDTDILAAEAAGMPSLIADFGYGPLVERAKAFSIFSAYEEAPRLVRRALSAASPMPGR